MLHEPVGNMESVIRKLERFELPKSLLLHTYQNILKAQLRYELKLNEKAFFHKDMHEDEIKLLHIRNQKIRQAESYLKKSEAKQSPELDILKSAAIYFHCPVPQTHEYMNGETALTFSDEPDLFSLTNLVTTLEPLARQKDANPQFVKYFSNLQQKKSQVLLDESLRNSLRQGIIGIKLPKVRIDLLHENLPKIHVSRPNLTGIVRDYVTVGSNVSQYDKQFLKETLIDDTKSFLLNTKLFKTNYKNSTDITSQLSALVKKIDRVDYVIGADEINEFINLTKDHSYFKPDKNLVQINVLIEDTRGFNFDSIRTKKAQKKMNSLYILLQLVSLGSGGIYNQHQKFAETMNHVLSQADGDPLRPYQAIGSIVNFGQQFLEHQGNDPAQTALTYLENPDHVRPVASYLLYDYFESLQNFPEKDRERLVGKATDFITEVATRYQLKDDPNHDSLVKYFTTVSQDPEMQKLLSYSILPFTVYMAEHEDLAREQLLQKIQDHWFDGEYNEIIPHVKKIVNLFKDYDPDNIKLDFDNPDKVETLTNRYTIPQETIDRLNGLPHNPNFLPLPEFFSEIESSYEQQWHNIYGEKSVPPIPYRTISQDITQEKTVLLINKVLTQVFNNTPPTTQNGSETSGDSKTHDIGRSFSQENGDWFTDSMTLSESNIKDMFDRIPENDPYRAKFTNGDGLLNYYQDYVHYIKANGSPDNPIPESDLFGYALVKCNGNYSDALKEMAVLYKFLARDDLASGYSNNAQEIVNPNESASQTFFRTKFLEVNLPILESIGSQTKLLSDPSKIIKELPKGLIDQQRSLDGLFAPIDIGGKEIDLADIWGEQYHRIAALALTTYTTQSPSLISLGHAVNEFPFRFGTTFTPGEQGSTKFSEIILSDIRNIKFADETLPTIPIRSKLSSNLPTILTVKSPINENEIGKIININSETSAVSLPDPGNKNQQIIYYGPSNLIKLLTEKGYAPANFSSEFNFDFNDVSPELLNFFLSSNIEVSPYYYRLDMYPEADRLKVAQILLDNNISILSAPENLDDFLKFGLDVPTSDITKVLEDPNYYIHIVDALPFLVAKGLIKSDHPLVKFAIENSPEATFNYYNTLSLDDQYNLKKSYPDLEIKLENYAVSALNGTSYSELSALKPEQIQGYFSFLLHGLRDDNKYISIRDLNFILPYLSSEQLQVIIQNKNLTEKDFSEIFSPGFVIYADEGSYQNLPTALTNIESVVADHPDLMLYLVPALLKERIWDLDKSQEKIDDLINQSIKNNHFEFFVTTSTLYYLQKQGYIPSPELTNQLVELSMSLIKSHKVYDGIILGHFASPEQFTSAIDYLDNLTNEDVHHFISQLFYERFGQYSTYVEGGTIPISINERDLLNSFIADDTVLPLLEGEGGLISIYYNFADNLTETNAHRLYDLNLSTMSEMERYRLVTDMDKHNFNPPAYVFNHDKFIEQIYVNYTSERFYIFDSSSNDFVKNNLKFSEFLDIFNFISKDKEHGYFNLYLNEDVIKVFNHEYFASIPGYAPELEKELVANLISQLSTIEKDRIPWESIYFASYLTSQQPDFDYGPYFVAWITGPPMWNIKNIVEDNPIRTELFIETASQIKSEYWDEIRANDLEKYNYLQNLITSSKENINNHKR